MAVSAITASIGKYKAWLIVGGVIAIAILALPILPRLYDGYGLGNMDRVTLELSAVRVQDQITSERVIVFGVVLEVNNPTDAFLRLEKVQYDLVANGEVIATDSLQYEGLGVGGCGGCTIFPKSIGNRTASTVVYLGNTSFEAGDDFREVNWSIRGNYQLSNPDYVKEYEFTDTLRKE